MSHFTTEQKTLSTTALMVAPKSNRKSLQVLNTDPVITAYIGTSRRVNSTNGFPLLAGASYEFDVAAGDEVWAIAASGAPILAYIEEFTL